MLGRALKQLRLFHGLKQTELASRLSVSPSYISEIESGQKDPSLELIQKYALEFRVPASSVLFFAENVGRPAESRKPIADKILSILEFISHDEEANDPSP